MKRIPLLIAAVVVAVVVLIVAVSGGSAKSGSPSGSIYGSAATPSGASAGGVRIGSRHTSLGTFLVDGRGRTLYLFEADKAGMSNCSGSCQSIWPPLTAKSAPEVAAGVQAGKVSLIKGANGTSQVAYAGHPLYTYAGDTKPGATQGQGLDQFGAKWYVLTPRGSKIDDD